MISELVKMSAVDSHVKDIALKILDGTRITPAEGVALYTDADTSLLAMLADQVRKRTVGEYVFYNRNVHIEPTNICVYDCKFCSYSHHQSRESWELTIEEMAQRSGVTREAAKSSLHRARALVREYLAPTDQHPTS
ncbi:MAG TPA: hypothetical protein PKN21_08560 [Bacteroidales bacterium]|nr:hypothetical protein [Bacteroidales bacterium]